MGGVSDEAALGGVPASMRASIAFIVCARREISSRAAGTATRSDRSAVLIADTWVRIRSTGRNDRPTNP